MSPFHNLIQILINIPLNEIEYKKGVTPIKVIAKHNGHNPRIERIGIIINKQRKKLQKYFYPPVKETNINK